MTSSFSQGYSNSNPNVTKGLQESSPSAIIELFRVDLIPNIHYVPPTTIDTSYFFHDGTSNNNFGSIKWSKGDPNYTVVELSLIHI